MASKAKSGPCTSESLCPGMQMAIDGGGHRDLGFHWAMLMNLSTGEVTSRLAYRLPKKTKGKADTLMINHCPWCGARVAGEAPRG